MFKKYTLLLIESRATGEEIEVSFIAEYLGTSNVSYLEKNHAITKLLVIPSLGPNKGKIISITPDQIIKIIEEWNS